MSRLLIAIREVGMRRALALVLCTALPPVTVAAISSWHELVASLKSSPADLVIVDLALISDAAMAVQVLRSAQPRTNIVIMSTRPEDRRRALAAGADAFLSTIDAPAHVVGTVRHLLEPDNDGRAANPPPKV